MAGIDTRATALLRSTRTAEADAVLAERDFVTLEDESDAINVIVWPSVAEAQRRALLASTLLTVYGIWQCQGEVRHLVAKKLIDHAALLQGLAPKARNFR